MIVLILLFGAGLTLLLLGMTTVLGVTGTLRWTPAIRRDTLRMYAAGALLAMLAGALWLGLPLFLSTWPFWTVVVGVAYLCTWLLDRVALRPDAPRVIEHQGGGRALIKDERYKPLPPPQPPRK